MYTLRLPPPIVSSTNPVFNFSYFFLHIHEYYPPGPHINHVPPLL
nr:MAG TPA: hypothetical protein [Caudoviricetes sp.]